MNAVLWTLALTTFLGWRFVDAQFGLVAAQQFFYVMQGVLGLAVVLCAIVRRPAFLLVVYCAVEYVLTAACGAWWFWIAAGGVEEGSICRRGHGWAWIVIGLCAVTLLGLNYAYRHSSRS